MFDVYQVGKTPSGGKVVRIDYGHAQSDVQFDLAIEHGGRFVTLMIEGLTKGDYLPVLTLADARSRLFIDACKKARVSVVTKL